MTASSWNGPYRGIECIIEPFNAIENRLETVQNGWGIELASIEYTFIILNRVPQNIDVVLDLPRSGPNSFPPSGLTILRSDRSKRPDIYDH